MLLFFFLVVSGWSCTKPTLKCSWCITDTLRGWYWGIFLHYLSYLLVRFAFLISTLNWCILTKMKIILLKLCIVVIANSFSINYWIWRLLIVRNLTDRSWLNRSLFDLLISLDSEKSFMVNKWILSKCLFSLLLSQSSLLSSLCWSLSLCLSITALSLSDLITKVHACKSVHQAIFILEASLSHIKCLLHSHCKSDTKRKNKAW